MAGDGDEVFMTRNLNFTPKTAQLQHLIKIVRSGKSEAELTIFKRLCSRHYTVEALLTDIKHRAASRRQHSSMLVLVNH